MLVTPTQIQVMLDRHQHLRTAIARDCLIVVTAQPSNPAPPRTAGRIRAGLRHAVLSLVALASVV